MLLLKWTFFNWIIGHFSIDKYTCKGFIKPSITLSGEPVNGEKVMEAVNALLVADLLIIVGSNLSIHPTPYLLQFYHGNNIITLNNSTHNLEDLFKDLYEKI